MRRSSATAKRVEGAPFTAGQRAAVSHMIRVSPVPLTNFQVVEHNGLTQVSADCLSGEKVYRAVAS